MTANQTISKCLKEDVRFLDVRIALKPSSSTNFMLERAKDEYPAQKDRADYYYKTKGGTQIVFMATPPMHSLDTVNINAFNGRRDEPTVLRLVASPKYVWFWRWAHPRGGCGDWIGDYLQVGKGEDDSAGSMWPNPDFKEIDDILADIWNKKIDAATARAKITKLNYPELAVAVDKLALVKESNEVTIAKFVVSGTVRSSKDANLDPVKAEAFKADFEIPGELLLKKRTQCIHHENPADDPKAKAGAP